MRIRHQNTNYGLIRRHILCFLFFLCSVWLFSQTNEVKDALEKYQYQEALSLLDTESPTFENLLLKAHCQAKLYNYATALDIYGHLSEEYPDNLNLMVTLAECARQAGDSRLSLLSWIKADSLSPDNQYIQTQTAMAFFRNNNWNAAIEKAKTVFEKDSVSLLLRMVADAYLYTNQGDSAVWYYSRAISENPSDHLSVTKLGEIYMGAKFYDAAIDLTRRYLENINLHQLQVGQLNGMAHYSAGNYEDALQRLKENVALGDSSYTTCYYLGMTLYACKLYYESVSWLEKAYNQNDTDVNLLYYYGTALSRTYDRKKGIEVLSKGVELIEKMQEMLFDFDRSFAEAYMRSESYLKAIDYFRSAYRRNPEVHSLLYNIGYCYDLNKDAKNAINYYERFLKTIPKQESGDIDKTTEMSLYETVGMRLQKLKEDVFFNSNQ